MLVLSRKTGEEVVINGGEIIVYVVGIFGEKVRLGFIAPRDLTIHRREMQELIDGKETRNGAERETAEDGQCEDPAALAQREDHGAVPDHGGDA